MNLASPLTPYRMDFLQFLWQCRQISHRELLHIQNHTDGNDPDDIANHLEQQFQHPNKASQHWFEIYVLDDN